MEIFEFVTDTAAMCIFDLESLLHRHEDDADWWSMSAVEVNELNCGNVAFVNLGSDGKYVVKIDNLSENEFPIAFNLHCPSGRIFIGAAEEVTSDGLEPECVRGGKFIFREPGFYRIMIKKIDTSIILLCMQSTERDNNNFNSPLRL